MINGEVNKTIFIGESFGSSGGCKAVDDEDGPITINVRDVVAPLLTGSGRELYFEYSVHDPWNAITVHRIITIKNPNLIIHTENTTTTQKQVVTDPAQIDLVVVDTSSSGTFYQTG